MIDRDSRLSSLVDQIGSAEWVALDLEADSLHSYPEKVCLIQISLPGVDALVDPLSGLDLSGLWNVLEGRELIMHGCDYDLRMLRRDFNFRPCRVFDTMVASRLAGHRQFGLGNLVQDLLDVKLNKASQKANWSIRPLTEAMEQYARNDTRYLEPVASHLRQELRTRKRYEWLVESCAKLVTDFSVPPAPDKEREWRIKGSARLERPELAVLRELWYWRESEARISNRPPFFVLSHDRMIQLAILSVKNGELNGSIPHRMSTRKRRGLMDAIHRAGQVPAHDFPKKLRNRGPVRGPLPKEAFDRLKKHRDQVARKLDIDPTLIGSRADLEELCFDWDQHAAHLMQWQRDLLSVPVHPTN